MPRHRPVYDRYRHRARAIGIGKITSLQKRRPERLEVARTCSERVSLGPCLRFFNDAVFESDFRNPLWLVAQWKCRTGAGCGHRGYRAETLEQIPIKTTNRFTVRIFREVQVDARAQNIFRAYAKVNLLQLH